MEERVYILPCHRVKETPRVDYQSSRDADNLYMYLAPSSLGDHVSPVHVRLKVGSPHATLYTKLPVSAREESTETVIVLFSYPDQLYVSPYLFVYSLLMNKTTSRE